MSAASDVQTLFNGKARSWQSKYAPGGKLKSRLDQFTERLFELCVPPGDILDLGCGTGEMAAAMTLMGYRVIACDIAENMIDVARNNWARVEVDWVSLTSDWTVLPFENQSFNSIVASSVFEYLPDIEGVLRELSRVLRPDGTLIFSVPNPFNRIRRTEKWLRSGLLPRTLMPLFCRIRWVNAYLTYLRLSRNRFGVSQWKSLLASAGFTAMHDGHFSEESWLEQANVPLVLVAVKKAVTG